MKLDHFKFQHMKNNYAKYTFLLCIFSNCLMVEINKQFFKSQEFEFQQFWQISYNFPFFQLNLLYIILC